VHMVFKVYCCWCCLVMNGKDENSLVYGKRSIQDEDEDQERKMSRQQLAENEEVAEEEEEESEEEESEEEDDWWDDGFYISDSDHSQYSVILQCRCINSVKASNF